MTVVVVKSLIDYKRGDFPKLIGYVWFQKNWGKMWMKENVEEK